MHTASGALVAGALPNVPEQTLYRHQGFRLWRRTFPSKSSRQQTAERAVTVKGSEFSQRRSRVERAKLKGASLDTAVMDPLASAKGSSTLEEVQRLAL